MKTKVIGDVIVTQVGGKESAAKLAGTLMRIYRSAKPEQITSLLSQAPPFVLIRNIDQANATKLAELLQTHEIVLEFVPSEVVASTVESPPVEPSLKDSGQPHQLQESPGVITEASVQSQPVLDEPPLHKESPAAVPKRSVSGKTITARRVREKRRRATTSGGKLPSVSLASVRTAFRWVRIAFLSILLVATLVFAFQVYFLKKDPSLMTGIIQDKLNTSGIVRTSLALKSGAESAVLQVLSKPFPSILSVKANELRSVYDELLRAKPDRRFLMAFQVLTARWAQASSEKSGKYEVRTAQKNGQEVVLELTRGKKVLHRMTMPLPTSFQSVLLGMEQWLVALDTSAKVKTAAPSFPVRDTERLLGAQQLIDAVDPRFAVMSLSLLEDIQRQEGAHPEVYLEGARAYTALCLLLETDIGSKVGELAAEALAFLALARHADPDISSDETEALLAAVMDYKRHAIELLERPEKVGGNRRANLLAAYIKEDLPSLRRLVEEQTGDATQVLGEYLKTRLLREMGLYVEAKDSSMELLQKWPFYPAVLEVIHAGDLSFSKVLTILYPLDILWVVESKSAIQAYDESSLEERFSAFEGRTENDIINITRFRMLLGQWEAFGKGKKPSLFVDEDRARRVFDIMYTDALYLRFNLLLNRWGVAEYAKNFASSVAVGAENDPLALYMMGWALLNLGNQEEASSCFRKILEIPGAGLSFAANSYWYSERKQTYSLIPLVYAQLDGSPSNRFSWGRILIGKLYDMDGALHVFKEALEQNPYMYSLYKQIAYASGSEVDLLSAVERHPYSYQLLLQAAEYMKIRNDLHSQEKALEYYSRALEMFPSRRDLVSEKGIILKRLKRYREAIDVYTKWIEDYGSGDLGEVVARAGRAEAIRKMGRPEEALASMEGAEDSYQASAMLQAAMCYEDMGNRQMAAQWYFRAAERYETSLAIAVDCAKFLWKADEYEAAAKMLQRNRKNTNDGYWYAGAFAEVFAMAPSEKIRRAVDQLRKNGAVSGELMTISHVLERKGRLEEAFEISSNTRHTNAMLTLENITTSYTFLRRLKGREAASNYLWQTAATLVPMKDMVLLTLLSTGGFEAFMEEVGDPDSYNYPEYAWLLSATAWKATDEKSASWGEKITRHYENQSGQEPYFSIGRYLTGKIGREEVMQRIVTPKSRVEVPYFLGLAERLRGNFQEANAWYQLCMLTCLENNLEYHSAGNELLFWSHLGSKGRNRLPGDDRDAVRWKMINQESDVTLLDAS